MSSPTLLEDYVAFINEPKHLINPYRESRMFDSDFVEFFSKTPWYVIPLFYLPQAIYMIVQAFYIEGATAWLIGLCFLGGIFYATLMEYLLHRFLFHGEDYWLPNNGLLISFHYMMHGIHHAFPQEKTRLVLPIVPGTIFVLCFAAAPALSLFSTVNALPLIAGAIVGYVKYDVIHYFLHHSQPRFAFVRELKTHHMAHHYRNGAVGFGVSSMFWDKVFRT